MTSVARLIVAVLALVSGSVLAQPPEESQTMDPLVQTADQMITAALEKERIPGAVFALVRDGRIVVANCYGVADLSSGRGVTADTVFRIGSITKVLTAIGLMQLVDEGKFSLEDPVNQHLTQFQVANRFSEPVRVRHLLTHTAGFDQRFMGREGARESDRFSLATFLQDNLFLIRPPGEFASYDTYGITLAGHLIEQSSALPYEVALRQRLFGRIGMSRSSIGVVPAAASSDAAVGYRVTGSTHRPEAWEHYRSVPASSVNSTANDMAAFMLTVLGEGATAAGGRAWSEKLGRQLQQPQYQNGPEGGFAYGFWDETRDGMRGIFHGGIMNGYTSQMYLVPEREFGFFVAYNRDGAPTSRLRDDLTAAMLRGLGSAPAAPAVAPPVALTIDVEEFAGTYADATYCHTCYENESEGGMSAFPVEAAGPGRLEFSGATWVAVAPLEFVNENSGRRAWFKRSEDGRISHFAISHRTYEKLTERLVANVAAASGVPVDRHPFAPRVYRLTQQHARAAEAYGRLAQIRPWDGVLHHYHGQTLLAAGNATAAIAALERAAAAEQWPSPTWYMLATAQAAQRNGPAALDALDRAVAAGFRDAGRLRQDRAFDSVRSDPRFAKIMESIGGR